MKIEYGDLYVSGYGEGGEIKLPINKLPELEEADAEHIHGFLRITIGDEKIQDVGYFSENDACFNDWLSHLVGIVECFSTSPQSRFLFYDGGQGSSAFEFCRDNDLIYISHVDTEIYYATLSSEFFDSGRANPENESHYICNYKDFEASVRNFIKKIKKEILSELGDFGSIWWELNIHSDGRCSNIKNENFNIKSLNK